MSENVTGKPTETTMLLICKYNRRNNQAVFTRSTEICLVTIAVISLMIVVHASHIGQRLWFTIPVILAAGAIIPTIVRKSKPSRIGLNLGQPVLSVRLLVTTCLAVFPITFAGLWFIHSQGIKLPLAPTLPNANWAGWILYQFLYVAVAEELFFRGYLQGNLLHLTSSFSGTIKRIWPGVTIIMSAAIFAAAHVILAGSFLSALTFFPGLILGWLFLRSRSLLAPILFHGLANTLYAVLAYFLV